MPQRSETQADESEQQPGEAPAAGGTRRGLLIGAGLAGVAGLAAACGGSGGDDDAGGSGGDSGGSGGGSGGSGGGALAAASEIPVGGGKVFEDAKVVVCQPRQGEFKAFSAACTHRGCSVGSVSGGTINCPCHGSKFKIDDGSVVAPPADKPLEEKKITVQGDQIMLA
ncbi:Rieske (2Fe-2S) protein [Actinomadura madurae]|uniref:Cytochrome bc1 complex Rieske iron-sulfur subunit n=1 Tax=Actinomadura madurae TaxID=1993 RepID=A0A1I5UWI3_9ACTN|nr:Rieske (2Fe-2S) protein [Actinomadura madurae]SFP99578.1 Ferredoxin subunit of nitrite reductase or a ring-hydroxylating dioxygenase [Actinomadura madurae]SPT64619.1 Cytochrome b6-f complex iron-sulfur subunit [Actinomadura madurae]